jgi:hypothetical protein
MASPTERVYLQAVIVSSDPTVDISLPAPVVQDQTYQITHWASRSARFSTSIPLLESAIVRNVFSSVPVIGHGDLRTEYVELGQALNQMTELEEADDLKIDIPVYEAARYVAVQLMANGLPTPRLFNHGSKSVVFNWSDNNNNLYLTVSADKVSALISSPERIKHRFEVDYSRLPDIISTLSASVGDDNFERPLILFVTEAGSGSYRLLD